MLPLAVVRDRVRVRVRAGVRVGVRVRSRVRVRVGLLDKGSLGALRELPCT